jgi:hypothetical protein
MTFPLFLHIASGTSGILSGFAASFFRKGSRRHALAGNVFVVSMLLLSATGASMALLRHEPGNVMGGALTFYMVATAWITARREGAGTSIWDWSGLFVVLTLAVSELTYGAEAAMSPTGMKAGYPPGPYFMLGTVAVLASLGDIRMLVRKGISGTQRVARHLWRMCFAFFVAASSLFLARQQYFPDLLRRTGALYLLSFLPLLLMIFWLVRVRFAHAYTRHKRRPLSISSAQPSLSTR